MAIRLARIELGLRQADLSETVGCSRAWIAELEATGQIPQT